jgi:type IV secretion system protein VirD4
MYANRTGYDFSFFVDNNFIAMLPEYLIIASLIFLTLFLRFRMKAYQFNVQRQSKDTSSNLGSSRMASSSDITRYGLRENTGTLIGKDEKGYIRHPKLTDRLILAFRGGGKTSSLLVPLILDYMHVNKFITDIKGELTAITARKAKAAGREVFIIDPFNVVNSHGINIQTHGINPLAHLNHDDSLEMDRYISALASALCSSDGNSRSETEQHFSENAHIIIEGILDFYISKHFDQPDKMSLVQLHDWWLDIVNDSNATELKEMQNGSHKARAAAAQLFSAGKDESGSMKTTVYRQLQWLRSEHIRSCFLENDVNLDAFVSGSCDIYVVLPEDMIKAYSRMMRVVLALIKVKLLQAPLNKLKSDYALLLDECGQYGYCQDIELIINTMRYRNLKVWASFQTLAQVDVYKDNADFKGMPVKHFLGSDDIETLKWIQELGSKTTVLTENISRNRSLSQKGNGSSASENHSISETATDLIHFNHVREMADDEQYVFVKGMRPIRCKKAYYFKESIYNGLYDQNPLESRS